jgi:hypothetical protein
VSVCAAAGGGATAAMPEVNLFYLL